jgi:SDR family mycofactocin-dependent oxidoreductase
MGLLDGKVALVTGAARGQGRSHAVRLAEEGADVIAVDLCDQPDFVAIAGATRADLEDTEQQVLALDRRIVTAVGDVRDLEHVSTAVAKGVAELGGLDIVCANAGVWAVDPSPGDTTPEERRGIWEATVSINLTGVWNTLEAAVPAMIEGGRGGAIVITTSTAAFKGLDSIGPFGSRLQVCQAAYGASKHGLTGLMRSYAFGLAKHNIRVNCVAPTGVRTPMTQNAVVETLAGSHPELFTLLSNVLDVDAVEPEDISNAILYLVSDAGRYVTGTTIPVDAGFLLK